LKTKVKLLFVLFLVSGLLSVGTVTFAALPKEGCWNKWELGVGIGFNMPLLDTTYNHTYSPIFAFSSPDDFFSTASQLLNITHKEDSELNLSFILNHLITKKLGIQLLGVFHKTQLYGTDNSYYSYLEYTAIFWPSINPTLVTREYDELWPDTEGSLKQSTFCLNLVTRFHLGPTVSVDLSGGPGLFVFSGELSSLGYTIYKPRHSWFDYYPDKVTFSIKGLKLGLNIGGELNVPLMRGISLFLTLRYFYCPSSSTEINLEEIEFFIGGTSTIDEVESIMNPGPLKINPSFLILNAGFKLRF
jgi:hypothetical protein